MIEFVIEKCAMQIMKRRKRHMTNEMELPNQQKKRTCRIVGFAVPADHRVKLKENEKKDKYLNLARELKKLWNIKVCYTNCNQYQGLVLGQEDLEIRGRVETIQTTALLRSARILRRVLDTPSGNTGVKNSKRSNNNNSSFRLRHE